MSVDLPLLHAAPSLELRSEVVPCPEIGGGVTVRGLMASEAFAVGFLRSQALRRVNDERAAHAERVRKLPPGKPAPEFEPPELTFDEARAYGRYVSHVLAASVVLPNGLQMWSAEQWEVAGQHHPAMVLRLRVVAERLSGLDAEDVEKN